MSVAVDLFSIALSVGLLLSAMAAVKRLAGYIELPAESQRKLVHVATGLYALTLPFTFRDRWPVVALIGVSVATMLALRMSRFATAGIASTLHAVGRKSHGEIYLALAVGFLFFQSRDEPILYVLPILTLTLSDAAAALVGTRYGRRHFPVEAGVKSVEGVVAFFVVTWLLAMILLLAMTDAPRGVVIVLSLLVAAFGALVEADSWRGLDNLFVPLGVHFLLAGRLGATIVFPEPALGVASLRRAAAMTGPRAFLATGKYRALAALPEIGRIPMRLRIEAEGPAGDIVHEGGHGHPALVSFTSGSTGSPKGIVRSHGFLAAQNACLDALLRPADEVQTDLVAFPVFVIANLGQGVASALPDWRMSRHDLADAGAVARLIAQRRVSRMLAPPALCETVAYGPPVPGLRTVLTGGGPVFPNVLEALARRLRGDDIVAVYGSTEAEPIAVQPLRDISAANWGAMREGAGLLAGRPIPQARVAIVADEIQVAGAHVNPGYLDPAQDADTKVRREGALWHRTGDASRLDADGRLWLLGRLGARAGRWRAFEVEAAARRWRGVRQAALIPGSDPPTLAVVGAVEPDAQAAFPGLRARCVPALPFDRRHRSKIDYSALARALDKRRFAPWETLAVGALRLAFAARRRRLDPALTGLPVETVAIDSAGGARLAGWFLPGAPGRGAVLLLHGVTDNRTQTIERMRFLNREGFATFAIDLQAHGMSGGDLITLGARESLDARAAFDFLRAKLTGERIGVIAISLGGAAALCGDAPLEAQALALESVFPDIARAAHNRFRHFAGPLGRPLARAALHYGEIALRVDRRQLRPVDGVARVTAPLFVLSGARDPFTPLAETREIFDAATCEKTLWEVPGAGHVDIYAFAPDAYRRRMTAFLSETLSRRG